MNANLMPLKRPLKGPALIAGLGALATLGALAFSTHNAGSAEPANLAGSGDAPANTVFVEPSVAQIKMGATESMTTPESVLATSMAVPPIKAGG